MGPELFQEAAFAPVDEAAWRRLVDKALRGAAYDATLISATDDGIAYGPIAPRAEGGRLHARCRPQAPWTISQRIDDADAARAATQIAADLEGGATGFSLFFAGAPAAYGFGIETAALRGHLETIGGIGELRIEAPATILGDIVRAVDETLEADDAPVDFGLDFHGPGAVAEDELGWIIDDAFGLDRTCTVFRADGRRAHNAGASEAQELGFALAAAVDALRAAERRGIDFESALAATEFTLAADQVQFLTVAKIRALRQLHGRLQQTLNIDEPFAARVHAETSFRMLSTRDPETNILRNTIAVFAAGIGGADSISVLPHTLVHGLPDRFARRIARNTQTVLIEESNLAHVVDPAAGSGGIEYLTAELAAKAWQVFQEIESEGGLTRSLANGAITGRIAAMRDRRARAVAEGDRPILGTTIYPMAQERPVSVLERRQEATEDALAPTALHAAVPHAARKGEAA